MTSWPYPYPGSSLLSLIPPGGSLHKNHILSGSLHRKRTCIWIPSQKTYLYLDPFTKIISYLDPFAKNIPVSGSLHKKHTFIFIPSQKYVTESGSKRNTDLESAGKPSKMSIRKGSPGSRSSILGQIPIQIQGFDDQKLEKNLQLKKKYKFFWSTIAICLSPGLHKGRPSYRRILQPSKDNIQHLKTLNFLIFFLGHSCPPGSGYGSTDLIESWSNPDPEQWAEHIKILQNQRNWKSHSYESICKVLLKI